MGLRDFFELTSNAVVLTSRGLFLLYELVTTIFDVKIGGHLCCSLINATSQRRLIDPAAAGSMLCHI